MYNLVNSKGWKRRVLGLFSLEKRRSRRYLAAVIHYLTGLQKKERDRLFSQAPRERTRGNGHRLQQGKFWLNIRKKFLPQEWCRSGTGTREVMRSLSLEILQTNRTRPWAT